MKTEQHHFVLKEDGKIYWVEKMPDKPFNLNPLIQDIGLQQKYEREHQGYDKAIQSGIANAVEVSNQVEVKNWISNDIGKQPFQFIELEPGKLYSLQCSVEIRQDMYAHAYDPYNTKFVAIVSFQPPVEEGEKQVLLPRRLTAENGAKALLIGEFFETVELEEGSFELPVSWTTIKKIYEKIVDHYSKSVKEVSKEGEKEGFAMKFLEFASGVVSSNYKSGGTWYLNTGELVSTKQILEEFKKTRKP